MKRNEFATAVGSGSVAVHRTNWNGRADKSSKGCLVIDGRSWRSVEKQIEKSKNIYIKLNRK